jgi:hypothetical protein
MSGLIKVDRELKINANPLRMGPESVVDGRFNDSMCRFYDDFLGDTLNADFYSSSAANGGTAPAITVGANGLAKIVAGTGDNDVCEWTGEANWYCAQKPVIEVRYAVNAITEVALNVGFCDDLSATNDKIALLIATATYAIGTNVTDAALFVFDTDATSATWRCASTLNGATPQNVTLTGIAPVAATFEVIAIHLDELGNARFYRNGVQCGYLALAVTPAVALRPYLAVKANTTTGRELTADYIKIWQNRRESSTVVW